MTTPACPEPTLLLRLLDGELSREEQAELTQHLDGCRRCQQAVQDLASGGRSWSETAAHLSGEQPGGEREPALRRAVEELAGGEPDRTPADHTTADEPPAADANDLSFLAPSDKPGHLGRLGHYEILEVVGRGGMGVVLRAFDEKLHRVVAVKVLAPQLAVSGTARKRFLREAHAAAAVAHEHVVAIHEVEGDAPIPYLVMQFVAGMSVEDRIRQGGPVDLKEVLRIGMQVAAGLAAAHAQGLVHRDVKPANILLENGVQRVKITDFGLARAADDASLTQSGVIAGTPMFMSPEQARGEAVDHRSDLFSLGSVLYALCTGRAPFRATGTMAVLKRVCEDTPRPIREINADVPDWLAAIVMKLLAKEPAQRFQSAAEVAELLSQHLAHLQQPHLVARPPSVVTARHPARRRRLAVALLVAAVPVAACVLLGTMAWFRLLPWQGGPVTMRVERPKWEQPPGPRPPRTPEELAKLPSPLDGRKHEDIWPEELVRAGGGNPAHAPSELVAVLVHGPGVPVLTVAVSPDGRTLASGGVDHRIVLWDLAGWKPGEAAPPSRSLEGHTDKVWSVAFSPDGKTLASGGLDRTVVLWDLASGRKVRDPLGQGGQFSLLAFSPDGQTLAAGTEDGTVERWDVLTGERREPLRFHNKMVRAVAFSPDGKLLASAGHFDKTVQVIDLTNRARRMIINGDTPFTNVAFSPDGRTLVAACDGPNPRLRAWDVESGAVVADLAGHTDHVAGLALHPGGRLAATGSNDGTVRLWDLTAGGSASRTFGPETFGGAVPSVTFTPEGRYLATANFNGTVAIFRVPEPPKPYDPGPPRPLPDAAALAKRPSAADALKRDGLPPELRQKLPREVVAVFGGPAFALPEGDPSWMTVSPDGKMLAVPCGDKVVVFDAHTGRHLRTFSGLTGRAYCVAFSPDSTRLAAGNWGGDVPVAKVWDVQTGQHLADFGGHTDNVNAVAFSPDGKQFLTASSDGTAKLFEDGKGRELKGETGPFYAATFSPDGKRVVTAGENRTVRVWDAKSGEPVKTLGGGGAGVTNATFSPDGKLLAGGTEEEWKLWDVENGFKEVRTVTGRAAWLAFAPDGKSLWGGGHNNSGSPEAGHVVKRWSLVDGTELASFELKGKGGWAAYTLSPDGKTLFEVTIHTDDHALRAYDTATGKERPSAGPVGPIYAVAVSPDGKQVASAGADGTVGVWDLATGDRRYALTGHPGEVRTVAFSPDGRFLASGGQAGEVFLWDVGTGRKAWALTVEAAAINQVAFSPDSRLLACAVGNGRVQVWEVSSGTLRFTARADGKHAWCVAFSPDGKALATGGEEGVVRLFDVGSGWQVRSLSADVGAIHWCGFRPDGVALGVSGQVPPVLLVWDLATGAVERPVEVRENFLTSGAWHPGGRLLATAEARNGTLRLWDLGQSPYRGREVRLFPPDTKYLHGIAFTPEGRHLVTANPDGTVYVVRLAKP